MDDADSQRPAIGLEDSISIPASLKPARRPSRGREFLMDEPVRQVTADGGPAILVPVRLTSYRSLPLSCVEAITISLDDAPIRSAAIRLRLNGNSYALDELGPLSSVWWWILDPATLLIRLDTELAAGSHRLDAELVTVEPYVTNGRFHFHYPCSRTFSLEASHTQDEGGNRS